MTDRRTRPRRPAWMAEGEEPDYRFSLANERTFLAWIRTALALIAAAVAVVQLVPPFRIPAGRSVLGGALAVTGLSIAATAYLRWAANERAMRGKHPLPYSGWLLALTGAITAIAVVVLGLIAISRG